MLLTVLLTNKERLFRCFYTKGNEKVQSLLGLTFSEQSLVRSRLITFL